MSEKTYSGEIAEKYCIGFTWNPDAQDAADKLYELYNSFDKEKARKGSEDFLRDVIKETEDFKCMLMKFLN